MGEEVRVLLHKPAGSTPYELIALVALKCDGTGGGVCSRGRCANRHHVVFLLRGGNVEHPASSDRPLAPFDPRIVPTFSAIAGSTGWASACTAIASGATTERHFVLTDGKVTGNRLLYVSIRRYRKYRT